MARFDYRVTRAMQTGLAPLRALRTTIAPQLILQYVLFLFWAKSDPDGRLTPPPFA